MKVDVTRATQAGYVGLAMRTRVAFGASAAEPEYYAINTTSRRVLLNSTMVIQSGGQYDGKRLLIETRFKIEHSKLTVSETFVLPRLQRGLQW